MADNNINKREAWPISLIMEEKKNRGGVIIQAIISGFEERTQKDGKPYTTAILSEKEMELPIKMFGTSKAEFLKLFELEEDKSYLVQVSGDYQIYNDEPGLVVKPVDNYKAVIKVDYDPTPYICSSVYPIDVMEKSIKNVIDGIQDGFLKKVATMAFRVVSSKAYYPYSAKIHPEKGGNLQYHYNVIQRILSRKNVDCCLVTDADGKKVRFPNFNTEICIVALLMHNTGVFDRLKVDELTGRVLEEDEEIKLLMGKMLEVEQTMRYTATAENQLVKETGCKADSSIYANFSHTVFAALGVIDVATKEAEVLTSCMEAEYLDSKYTYVKRATAKGNTSFISVNGVDKKLVNL